MHLLSCLEPVTYRASLLVESAKSQGNFSLFRRGGGVAGWRLRGWGDGDGGFELSASAAVAHGGERGQEHEGGEEDEYAFRGGASGVGGVEEHEKWGIMSGEEGMSKSGLADLFTKAS